MSEYVDYANLIVAVKGKLNEKQSGMMFIKPEDGHPIVLALKEGTIFSAYSSTAKGKSALHQLAGIERASVQFNPTSSPMILPGTEVSAEDAASFIGASAVASPTLSTTENTAVVSAGGAGFHDKALALVKEYLIDIMGPFSVVAIDDAMATMPSTQFQAAGDLHGLLGKLATEIDDKQEAAQFIQQTESALEQLYKEVSQG